MVKLLSILFFKIIFFFLFFLFSLFSFFLLPSSFFYYYFVFTFFSGHKTISCSDFLLKPPTKHFKLCPSSFDSHLPHSPTSLQFYLARVGGFEVCFSNSCVFSPSGPQPPQTPHSTTPVQPDFMQKRTAVTQLQSQWGTKWPKPAIAPELDHSLTAQAGRFCQVEEGSEKTGLRHAQLWSWSFHFPRTYTAANNPHFPKEPPIQSRAGPAESLILLILPSEGRKQALPSPTYTEA